MENQERDVGPVMNGEKEIIRRSSNKERLTIMIFKKVGKVRTFEISPLLLLCASLFFLLFIVAAIILANLFLDYYSENKMQTDKIAELSRELNKTKKSLERSEQHVALLDDYIKEKSPEPMSSTGGYIESSSTKLVSIEELKILRDRSTIDVTFRIKNRQLNEEPISGYIFLLTSIKDSDQSEVWVYPSSPLKDGLPTNYRRGQRFLIQRFKTISSKYKLSRSIDKALILEIVVYDRNGELILKKVVEV